MHGKHKVAFWIVYRLNPNFNDIADLPRHKWLARLHRLKPNVLTGRLAIGHVQPVAEVRLHRVADNLDANGVLLQDLLEAVNADLGGLHFASPVAMTEY